MDEITAYSTLSISQNVQQSDSVSHTPSLTYGTPSASISLYHLIPGPGEPVEASRLSTPKRFIFNLTRNCNLKCAMCTQHGGKFRDSTDEMSLNEWEKLIEQIAPAHVVLLGGEPLLYPGIRDVFRLLKEHRCSTEIVTNGFFLQEFLEDMVQHHVTINISIDGTERIHGRIRDNNQSFQNTCLALKKIEQLRVNGAALDFRVNFVLLPENLENITYFIEYIKQYNPSWITLQHLQYSNKALNEEMANLWRDKFKCDFKTTLYPRNQARCQPDVSTASKIVEIFKMLAREPTEFPVYFFPNLNQQEIPLYYSESDERQQLRPKRVCSRPWKRPTIDANGDVLICLDHSIGNVRNQDFQDIWNGQSAQEFRQVLRKVERFPICTRCCDFYSTPNLMFLKELSLDGKTLVFAEEVQVVEAAPDVAFLLDFYRSFDDPDLYRIPARASGINSAEQMYYMNKFNYVLWSSRNICAI